jgi:hypothetical protein
MKTVRIKFSRTGIAATSLLVGYLMFNPNARAGESVPGAYSVHEAWSSVDLAWNVYHRAALSGTLASPDLQTRIEKDLRRVRSLLVEARDQEASGDSGSLSGTLSEIDRLTREIIRSSGEPKP